MEKYNINIHIGQVIHSYRKLRGLTLADLAKKLDISYQQLQKYEKGINKISADKLFQLAEILNANPIEFFPGYSLISDIEDKKIRRLIYVITRIKDEDLKANLLKFLGRLDYLLNPNELDFRY